MPTLQQDDATGTCRVAKSAPVASPSPALRYLMYAAAWAAIMEAVVLASMTGHEEIVATENHVVQCCELTLLVVAGVFIVAARVSGNAPMELSHIMAGLIVLAIIRELDDIFALTGFENAWQTAFFPVLAYLMFISWRRRAALMSQGLEFSRTHAFALLFAGFVVVVGFSQIFGQQAFWEALMQGHYTRRVGRSFEEAAELLGYMLMSAGAVETFCLARLRRSA